jgi:hypothetical protein
MTSYEDPGVLSTPADRATLELRILWLFWLWNGCRRVAVW